MRRTFVIFSLALAVMSLLTTDAFAQRRGGGRARGGYYGGGSYYGRGYGYGGWGVGVGVWPGYYYGPAYGGGSPGYYYGDSVVQAPPVDGRQSFYSGPSTSTQAATVTVMVPSADTQVWFGNAPTTQRGMQRTYTSPALEPGYSYTYTVKARWTENGRMIERERQIAVQSGQAVTVDFRNAASERIATPKSNP